MKKKFFLLGIILAALGVLVGIFALIGVYLGSGTRLLTISTGIGHAVRYTPIGLIAAAVLLAAGIPMGLLCYVPSAKSLRRKQERIEAKAAKEAARQAVPEEHPTVPSEPAVSAEESPAAPAADPFRPSPGETVREELPQPEPAAPSEPEKAEPSFTPPAPAEAPAQTGPVCPACGTRNLPGSVFCTECGQRL